MLTVEWLEPAFEDLEKIIDYIANHNPSAAYDLEHHIIQLAESLADHPYKGISDVWQVQENILYIQITG
jgi:plasmid stabilization system protein ParE